MNTDSKIEKTKNPSGRDRFSAVDPARLALASSGTDTDMLLYALRARIHGHSIKQKRSPLQETFSAVPDL